MKRFVIWFLLVGLMYGCSQSDTQIEQGMQFRQQLLQAKSCEFDGIVTADYTTEIYTFKLHCVTDDKGVMKFEVIAPESIAGITGHISTTQSTLTFDDQVLAFAPLADGYITPVCAPWVVIRSLKSGYLNSCEKTDQGFILSIDDSYEDDALQVDVHFSKQTPSFAEILWKGRRVLTVQIENFIIT